MLMETEAGQMQKYLECHINNISYSKQLLKEMQKHIFQESAC